MYPSSAAPHGQRHADQRLANGWHGSDAAGPVFRFPRCRDGVLPSPLPTPVARLTGGTEGVRGQQRSSRDPSPDESGSTNYPRGDLSTWRRIVVRVPVLRWGPAR